MIEEQWLGAVSIDIEPYLLGGQADFENIPGVGSLNMLEGAEACTTGPPYLSSEYDENYPDIHYSLTSYIFCCWKT